MQLATATGTRLRGLHSNSRSSTARRIAATGVAKVADMPAAAPATSRVVRSASVTCIHCPISDPTAPPVMMIGPSAPNGPPEPIAIAAETGFRSAIFGVNLRAMQQDCLDGLGNPVSADLVGPETRHQPHQDTADYRDHHHPVAQRAACRRHT